MSNTAPNHTSIRQHSGAWTAFVVDTYQPSPYYTYYSAAVLYNNTGAFHYKTYASANAIQTPTGNYSGGRHVYYTYQPPGYQFRAILNDGSGTQATMQVN